MEKEEAANVFKDLSECLKTSQMSSYKQQELNGCALFLCFLGKLVNSEGRKVHK
uniref:Uncharacterized protein n=1 Tax=Lepeophtheirus salmonis TaxID=72036 RepID=A0A0K2TI10_LEPSM